MKHTIYGIALAVTAILVIAAIFAVSGKDVRENEIDKALNTAVEESLGQLKMNGGYEFENYQELIADFNQALLLHVSSDSDIKIEILTADLERGVLDVEIEASYQTVNGKKGRHPAGKLSSWKSILIGRDTIQLRFCLAGRFMPNIPCMREASSWNHRSQKKKEPLSFAGKRKEVEKPWLPA